MKAVGVVRKLDELGRIVIPIEMRRVNGIDTGTPMEIFQSEGGIVIRKYDGDKEKEAIINDLQHAVANASTTEGKVILQRALEFIEKN